MRKESSMSDFPEAEEDLKQLDSLEAAYKMGKLPPKVYIQKIVSLTQRLDLLAKKKEQDFLREFARKNMIDCLGTDKQGRRSAGDLDRGENAFATGVANHCFAVAVVHPERGMGAAHYNPITPRIVGQTIERRLAAGQQDISFLLDPNRANRMLTDAQLSTHVGKVVSSAFTEFIGISRSQSEPAILPQTTIFLAGLDFIDKEREAFVLREAVTHISSAVQQEQRGTGRKTDISVQHMLGIPQGVVYGGANHPRYNKPEFYKLT